MDNRGIKVAALMTREQAEELRLKHYPAGREDIQADNGQGGYRLATKEEQAGKVIAVGYGKELRRRGINKLPGQQAYVPDSLA